MKNERKNKSGLREMPLLFCLFFYHLSPMGPINELQRCPSRVWAQGIYSSLPGSRLRAFIAMQVLSTSTPRQPMVELYVLTSSRFPLRKQEEKCSPAESRTPNSDLVGVVPTSPRGQSMCEIVENLFALRLQSLLLPRQKKRKTKNEE